MAPRKKRITKTAAFSARTRSGVKYQTQVSSLKKNISKKTVDIKRNKEVTPGLKPTEAMLTRSHKKIGKFNFLSENTDTESTSDTSNSQTNTSESINENELYPLEEVLLPEPQISMMNEDTFDILISDDDSSDVILVENDSMDSNEFIQNDILNVTEKRVIIKKDVLNITKEKPIIQRDIIDLTEKKKIQSNVLDLAERKEVIQENMSNLTNKEEATQENMSNLIDKKEAIQKDLNLTEKKEIIKKDVLNLAEKKEAMKEVVLNLTETIVEKEVLNLVENKVVTQKDALNLQEKKVILEDQISNAEQPTTVPMDCTETQDTETVLTERLSNLDVNSQILDSAQSSTVNDHCVVEDIQYNTESEKENTFYHLDNFESEVIIDCIADDVIPISSEQEILNENVSCSDSPHHAKELLASEIELNKEEAKLVLKKVEVKIDTKQSEEELQELNEKVDIKEVNKEFIVNEKQTTNNIEIKSDTVELNQNEKTLESVDNIFNKDCDQDQTLKEVQKVRAKSKVSKKKPDKMTKDIKKDTKLSENSVRRSNRIKSISVLKQKSSKGHGLVKHKSEQLKISDDNLNANILPSADKKIDKQTNSSSGGGSTITHGDQKPVKVKSRWRRSSELELNNVAPVNNNKPPTQTIDKSLSNIHISETVEEANMKRSEEVSKRLKQFVHLKENLYLTERISCKEAKKMVCDCFLTEEDIEQGEYGCGEDCLNRLLMIECGNFCAVGDRCTNKRFQKGQFAPCEVFQTEKKGLGIRAAANIPYGDFILEYVGEVLDPEEFEKRATEYSKDKNQHYYFMSLRADAVIDATRKGNVSRFINHSCDPNAETQKWTVSGELRIGFFSKRTILAGEEITFDYQFQRYGKEAQKCFCEAATCRGWLGEEPDDDDDEDEDEEEEEEDEDEEAEEIETNKVETTAAIEKTVDTIPPEPIGPQVLIDEPQKTEIKIDKIKKEKKRILRQRLPRKDIFEDLDLDDEIDTLQTTGLKNQAHTLKLSRLMVRAKEPAQRTKLLRVLRRGEFPCRRLFLDYHGLRLIHGWMTDAQHMSRTNKKLESLRLEILQTLATLPIPNKTMLQDSKVLPTVQKWSIKLEEELSTLDSDSNSPKIDAETTPKESGVQNTDNKTNLDMHQQSTGVPMELDKLKTIDSSTKFFDYSNNSLQEDMDISPIAFEHKESITEVKNTSMEPASLFINDYETEIIALALKLLEEWSILKEVFRIPKKERIEQMKEHEREADRRYKAGLGLDGQEVLLEKKNENRYHIDRRQKKKKRKNSHKDSLDSFFVDKYERRKLFALQVEQREMERRRNQREFWRQHEQRCVVMGADPRFTAPFDPNQGYQCIWNPQTGQWQNYPLPGSQNVSFNSQNLPPSQSHLQPGQQFLGGGHMPPISNQPINHSSIMPPGQPLIKHMQPTNLPPHHALHSKSQIPFNSQPPPPIPPPNSTQPYSRPGLNMNLNLLPNMNSATTTYGTTNNQHIHQQRTLQQGISYSSAISDHIQQPLPPTYHIPLESQNPPPTQNVMHTNIPPMPSNVHNKPLPPLPALPYQENIKEQEEILQVKFMGPIPPPAKLPPKWKCAKDKYSRPYYYHIRLRKSQWEPPELPPEETEEVSESSTSSETSSASSDSSSEETDSEDDIDDAKLLLQLKNKFKNMDTVKKPEKSVVEAEDLDFQETSICDDDANTEDVKEKSLDDRLIEEFCFMKGDGSHSKKRRIGLVQEILISPRTEEDRLQFKEDMKRYKQNKEKLKRQKELLLEQSKKHVNVKSSKPVATKSSKGTKKHKISVKTKLKEMTDNESAKRIKESFRSSMAVVMVAILNAYRKPDCKEGRITNTDDFKHLARKLTHFVMLKELKHCQNIEDLTCTESVKSKAKEFVRKYMSKFGETYQKPKDETEFY